jgi:hypothetical protein
MLDEPICGLLQSGEQRRHGRAIANSAQTFGGEAAVSRCAFGQEFC